jgi:hypothetical protein
MERIVRAFGHVRAETARHVQREKLGRDVHGGGAGAEGGLLGGVERCGDGKECEGECEAEDEHGYHG